MYFSFEILLLLPSRRMIKHLKISMKLIIVMAWRMISTIAITKTTSCAQSTPTSFDRFDSFSESITF